MLVITYNLYFTVLLVYNWRICCSSFLRFCSRLTWWN